MASPKFYHLPLAGQEGSSQDQSAESSAPTSRGGSRPPREKQRVRFTPGGESLDTDNIRAAFDVRDGSSKTQKPVPKPRTLPQHGRSHSASAVPPANSPLRTGGSPTNPIAPSIRPSIMRSSSNDSEDGEFLMMAGGQTSRSDAKQKEEEEDDADEAKYDEKGWEEDIIDVASKAFSQQSAQQRAERLSRMVGSHSAPGSRLSSPVRTAIRSPINSAPPSPPLGSHAPQLNLDDLPLEKLASKRTYGIEDDTDEEDETEGRPASRKPKNRFLAAAKRLVKHHSLIKKSKHSRVRSSSPPIRSGQVTPIYEKDPDHYVPRPNQYREGYLASMLKLYNEQGVGSTFSNIPSGYGTLIRKSRNSSTQSFAESTASMPGQVPGSPSSSGTTTPKTGVSTPKSGATSPKLKHQKWYYKNTDHRSTGSIANLVNQSTILAHPGGSNQTAIRPKPQHKPRSNQTLDKLDYMFTRKKKGPEEIRIHVHIAETILRQKYLLKICKCLMLYGAPTHRLEEYMRMSARVLEIDGQFLYIPGCMIISFDDARTHTTEVKMVRANQVVNLGKFRDVYDVYKEVVHDTIGVEEAMQRIDEIAGRKDLYPPHVLVFVYGCASACVGPFAFGARTIDLPIAFLLGCLLGTMQLIIAPRSELYSNIFEISAAVFTSFLARAFGSLRGGNLFCFSALAQSAIALILPGYTVLCGSLELQSRSIVAGSVRMVYAIIYSLFLGFGITIGTSIYGAFDPNAVSSTVCNTKNPKWYPFIFVPPFTLCLIVINQGKAKQMPIMIVIAFVGYVVNHFSAVRFAGNAQIANTLGALAIGVLGNMYSRLRHGLAAAALIPAIFVQVPSGLAASGSLISGVTSANQITNKTVAVFNGTANVMPNTPGGVGAVDVNSTVLNVGYSMIQVAIGITVGLFLSALVVYPFGKRRSGLFSF